MKAVEVCLCIVTYCLEKVFLVISERYAEFMAPDVFSAGMLYI